MSDQIKAWQSSGFANIDREHDRCDHEEGNDPEDGADSEPSEDDEPSLCGVTAEGLLAVC